MAKVAFSKLKCKIDTSVKEIKIDDEIIIEVKQYLPIQEKLALIGRVVELAHEQDYNYANPVKYKVFGILEIIFAYTNISFTDKQRDNLPQLYDSLQSTILNTLLEAIPAAEIDMILDGIDKTIESIYKYQNSILGILDIIKQDYSNLQIDLEDIQNRLLDPQGLDLLKQIGALVGQSEEDN